MDSYNQNQKKYFSVIQWNARSLHAKKEAFEKIMISKDIDIALICETWFKKKFNYRFTGYNLIKKDRDDGKGGVAILIKKNISFNEIVIDNTNLRFEVCAISAYLSKNLRINFVSIYATPNTIIDNNQWRSLMNQITGTIFLSGDFNAKSRSFGANREDAAGRKLVENIDQDGLILLNNGEPTMVPQLNRTTSPLDLTIVSPEIAPATEWTVLDDPYGSNHFPIIIKLTINRQSSNINLKNKTGTNKIDWLLYKDIIDNNIRSNLSTSSSDDETPINKYNKFIETIENTTNLFNNKKDNKGKNRDSPDWWDEECTSIIKKRKIMFKKYMHTMNYENYIEYKKTDAEVKLILKNKKRTNWKKFCSSLDKNTPISKIWKKIKCLKNMTIASANPINEETLELFADMIAPPDVMNEIEYLPNNEEEKYKWLIEPFSLRELQIAINSKKDSSPGYDNITYSMIKFLPTSAKQILVEMFNEFSKKNVFPNSWTTQIIVPIPKSNNDPNPAKSYRPIALSSCIEKLFELLIKNRLEWFIENNNLYSNSQHGFRKNKSTLDNLTILTNDIYLSFIEKEYLTAIFIDIQSAYDNVMMKILMEKLVELKLPNQLINNIISLYSQRSLYIKGNNTFFGPRIVSKGLMQGGVLSPLLFLLYTNDIDTVLSPEVNIIQFADDVCLYTKSNSMDENNSRLEISMNNISTWLDKKNFKLEPRKTKAMIFTKKYKLPNISHININNIFIEKVEKIKFLGLILDTKLKWKDHIEYICAKCEKIINILRSIAKVWWGAHPSNCILIYRSMIRSIMDYGSPIFANAGKYLLKKLDILQYKALRISLGAMKTSPTNALLAEAGEMSLNLRRTKLVRKYLITKMTTREDPVLVSISDLQSKMHNNILYKQLFIIKNFEIITDNNLPIYKSDKPLIYNFPYRLILYEPNINIKNWNNISNNFIKIELWNILRGNYQDFEYIYTDGSKKELESHTGGAFYHENSGFYKQFKLRKEVSIFTVEAMAILKTLEYINSCKNKKKFLIISDSKSVLLDMENFRKKKTQNYLIHQIINKLMETKKDIRFLWIPSHVGIKGNEKVDKLAKDAIQLGETLEIEIPKPDVVSIIKGNILTTYQQEWRETSKIRGSHLYKIMPTIPKKPWYNDITLNRKIISLLIRLRLGHTTTPKHLFQMKIKDNPLCNCGEIGDINHLVLNCTNEKKKIDKFYAEISRCISFPMSVETILYHLFNENEMTKEIVRFLISLKLFI